MPLLLLRLGPNGAVRLGRRVHVPIGRNASIRFRDDILLRDRSHIAAGVALRGAVVVIAILAAVGAASAAAATARAAGVIAVAVAGVPEIGRIAVEVTPVALTATRPTPAVGSKQGEQVGKRTAIPDAAAAAASVAAAAAAVVAGAARRAAIVATGRCAWCAGSAWPASGHPTGAATVVAAVAANLGPARATATSVDRSAARSTTHVAAIVTAIVTALAAGAVVTGLEEAATGVSGQNRAKQTEKDDPFHDDSPVRRSQR
jgi:hypothetical protein